MIDRTRLIYEKGRLPISDFTSSRYIVKTFEEYSIKSLQEGYEKYQSGELREIIDPYSKSYQEIEKIFKTWLGRNFKPLRLKIGRKKNSEYLW